ncbi:MAG: cyclase [Alphaproteobacteria bacterium]|nr:MAG: cyclase [Alphaproteobacteria bacterium]
MREGSSAGKTAVWPGHEGNWGRWPNDRGTLNLITPQVVLRALRAVVDGRVVSCARPVTDREPLRGDKCYVHEMMTAGVWDLEPERTESLNSSDRVSYRIHGMVNTHIDALAHVGYDGKGFNGRPFSEVVNMKEGVVHGDVSNAVATVTRGVLIDVPAARGIEFLEPGDFVRPEELIEAAKTIEPGDAALIRVGGTLAPGIPPREGENRHGTWSGLHPECVDVLAERDISILGSDTGNDVFPSPYAHICRSPVHTLALTFYGIHLLHNMDLEGLAKACRETGRSRFMFMVSPLNHRGVTGSLVSPVAIL